jgi:hypothetical protein
MQSKQKGSKQGHKGRKEGKAKVSKSAHVRH